MQFWWSDRDGWIILDQRLECSWPRKSIGGLAVKQVQDPSHPTSRPFFSVKVQRVDNTLEQTDAYNGQVIVP
jgi:hypothetical protein